MATLTVNPDDTHVDGYVGRFTAGTFASVRGGAGDGHDHLNSPNTIADLTADAGGTQVSRIMRGILNYDTSGLGAGVNVSAATHDVYVTSVFDEFVEAASVHLVISSSAALNALADSDYNIGNWPAFANQADPLTIGGMTINARNVWTLTNLTGISLTGTSRYGLIISFDYNNTSPTLGANKRGRLNCALRQDASSHKPQLVITYTVVGGGRTSTLGLMGAG